MASLEHEYFVAGFMVLTGGLPGCRAGCGVDDHRPFGAKEGSNPFEHPQGQGLELRPAMVDGGEVDGSQNPVGHIGRAGNLQEVPTLTHTVEAGPRIDGGWEVALHGGGVHAEGFTLEGT